MKVKDIYDFINTFAPFNTQEEWDNSGLVIGGMDFDVTKIMTALDLTVDVVNQAAANGCELIVTHHPAIFHPIKRVLSDSAVYMAAHEGISVICAHTCLDKAPGGVNDTLASKLGLKNIKAFPVTDGEVFLRTGESDIHDLEEFVQLTSNSLKAAVSFVSGGKPVKNVAVCGGAGMSLFDDVLSSGCDTYVTADARHNEYIDAAAAGVNLVVSSHFDTENPVIPVISEKLAQSFPQLEIILAQQSCPYKTVVYSGV